MKKLQVFASMGLQLPGQMFVLAAQVSYGVGWERDDLPVIHVFAKAAPGDMFTASNGHGGPHWPCEICDAHGYSEADFHEQIEDALARGPA